MSKSTMIGIHLMAFVIGIGLGTFGWLGLIPIAFAGGFVGLVLLISKSMGMPNKDAPSAATFFASPVLVAAFGWFAFASEELGFIPAPNPVS